MAPLVQPELSYTASSGVAVTLFPDGEVRLKPKAPIVEGSVRQAAAVLGVSEDTVRRLLISGDLEGWKPAKRWWRLNMISVYEYKERRKKETGTR